MKISHILSLIRIPLGLGALFVMKKGLVEMHLLFLVLGIITDSLDGLVARKRGEVSKLGSLLDKGSDQIFELLLGLSLWLYASLPAYYLFALTIRAVFSIHHLYMRYRNFEEDFNKREVKVSSVLSLSVFFFYSIAIASVSLSPALSRGLMEIALPYVLFPIGALMEGINLLKLFPQLVGSNE